MRLALAATFAAVLSLAAPAAQATTILTFSQTDSANDVFTTNPTSSTTRISATDVGIAINSYLEGGTPISAFFSLIANSTAQAQVFLGSYFQTFDGNFTITSGTGGTGINYLSGSFSDLTAAQGSSASLRSSTPGQLVTFTSSQIPAGDLSDPLALALSFANVSPPVDHLCGPTGSPTLCSFSASVSGVFSAAQTTPIPEPASMALIGAGLVGLGVLRRRTKR